MDHTSHSAVTHDGPFHADDVFAAAALLLVHPDLAITRSRDEKIIAEADIVFDVGMVYDESRLRFDHHQEGGAGKRENGIPYSAFSLVWQKFGGEICGDQRIADSIDHRLVAYIDAYDNGYDIVRVLHTDYPLPYAIGDIVRLYKPVWRESGERGFDRAFFEAVDFGKSILLKEIQNLKSQYEAEKYILSVYNEAEDKKILIFDEYVPWDETVSKLPEPLFVVYPRAVLDGEWCAQVVRDDPAFFENDRISFPEAWAGKRDEDLQNISGVPGAVFAHAGRFLVAAKSKEAVLALLKKALAEASR